MAVKIRLRKMGSKKRPFYRVVAADSRSPRDGRIIETIGYYNPIPDPPDIRLDDDKVYSWLDRGALPTRNAANILKQAGLLERWQLLKQGVKISELDARIEERRMKQPRPKVEKEVVKEEPAPDGGGVEGEEAAGESAAAGGMAGERVMEEESRQVPAGAGEKPGAVEKPGAGVEPGTEEEPGVETGPEAGSKPGDEAGPEADSKPEADSSGKEKKQ